MCYSSIFFYFFLLLDNNNFLIVLVGFIHEDSFKSYNADGLEDGFLSKHFNINIFADFDIKSHVSLLNSIFLSSVFLCIFLTV